MINSYLSFKNIIKLITYLLCLIYFLFNFLYQLNEDQFQVIYKSKEVETSISEIIICLDIDEMLFVNCSEIKKVEYEEKCEEINEFLDYIVDDEIIKSPKDIINKAEELKFDQFFNLEPKYDNTETYLLNKLICIKYYLEEDNHNLFQIFNLYSMPIFVFFKDIDKSINKNLFFYDCYPFSSCHGFILNRFQITLTYLESPYVTDCMNYENEKFNFTKYVKIESRYDCFNECIKSRYKLNVFYYSKNDTDIFKWDDDDMIRNNTLKDELFLKECSLHCPKINCLHYVNVDLGFTLDNVDNRIQINIDDRKIEINAIPLLIPYQFYLQSFGLLSCLFGFSLLNSIDLFIIFLNSKLTIITSNIFQLIFKLKNILFLLIILFLISNLPNLFRQYYGDTINTTKEVQKTNHINYKVYFCFPIFKSIEQMSFKNLLIKPEKEINEKIFDNYTIDYLLRNVKNFDNFLIDVQSNLRKNLNFTKDKLVFNKKSICYEILIDINQDEFIIFNFNLNLTKVYFMSIEMNLNFKSRIHLNNEKNNLESKLKIGKFSDCIDYSKFSSGKCRSKESCIEKCIIEKYSKKYPYKLPLLIIFESDLSKKFRNYSFICHIFLILIDVNKLIYFDYYFDHFIYKNDININLCIEHHINLNRSITGLELFEKTEFINIESLIEDIEYLDKNYNSKKWFPLLSKQNLDDNIKMKIIFYQQFKCITISYFIDTSNNLLNFYYYIIKININQTNFKNITYFTNSDYTYHFLEPNLINTNETYQINLDKYTEIKADYFGKINFNPINQLLDNFKQIHNFSTLKLPLDEQYFHLKINDTLFNQFLINQNLADKPQITERYVSKINLITENFTICIAKNTFENVRFIIYKKSLSSLSIEIINSISIWSQFTLFDLIYLFLVLMKQKAIKFKFVFLILHKFFHKYLHINRIKLAYQKLFHRL